MDQTKSIVEKSMDLTTAIFGDKVSYYKAKAFIGRGDLFLEDRKNDECEEAYLKANIIVTELYGNDHPMIIYYNAAIIDAK